MEPKYPPKIHYTTDFLEAMAFVWVFCLHIHAYIHTYVHTYICTYVHTSVYYALEPDAQKGQKAQDPFKLELQVVVSCHMVLGIKPGCSERASATGHGLLNLLFLVFSHS